MGFSSSGGTVDSVSARIPAICPVLRSLSGRDLPLAHLIQRFFADFSVCRFLSPPLHGQATSKNHNVLVRHPLRYVVQKLDLVVASRFDFKRCISRLRLTKYAFHSYVLNWQGNRPAFGNSLIHGIQMRTAMLNLAIENKPRFD